MNRAHVFHGLKAVAIRHAGNLLSAALADSVDSLSVGRSGPVAFFATLGDFCPKNPDRTAKGQAQTSAECGVRKLSAA